MCPEEPDLTTGTVVFALLLNKSAIGIYTTHKAAEKAWELFQTEQRPENKSYQIKPFKLDGAARIYRPY